MENQIHSKMGKREARFSGSLDDPKEDDELEVKAVEFEIPATSFSRTEIKESKQLIKELVEQSTLFKMVWPMQYQQTQQLESEVASLEHRLQELEAESIQIKRKRWCYICESEATYLDKHRAHFFCSKDCEDQYIRFTMEQHQN